MSERRTTRDFEDDVRRAMRSYAEEGARAFDPGHISAQARSAGAGVRGGRVAPRRSLGSRACASPCCSSCSARPSRPSRSWGRAW